MNQDQIDDLLQLITATLSQTEARLTEKIDAVEVKINTLASKVDSLETTINKSEQKIDDGFAGIGDALGAVHEGEEQLEERIVALEQKAA